jgi:hypothetical protein
LINQERIRLSDNTRLLTGAVRILETANFSPKIVAFGHCEEAQFGLLNVLRISRLSEIRIRNAFKNPEGFFSRPSWFSTWFMVQSNGNSIALI